MIGSKNISCICLKGRLTEIKTFSDAQSQLMHFLKERGCQGSSMLNLVYLTNGSKKAYELMYIFLKTINVKFVLFMGTEIGRDKAVFEHLHSQYFSARTILPYISFLLLISFVIEQDRIIFFTVLIIKYILQARAMFSCMEIETFNLDHTYLPKQLSAVLPFW